MNTQQKVYYLIRVMEYGPHGVTAHPVAAFDGLKLAEQAHAEHTARLKEFAGAEVAAGLGRELGITRVQYNIMETPLFTENRVVLVSAPKLPNNVEQLVKLKH